MDLTPDQLLSILFIAIIVNTAIIVVFVVSGRLGRRRPGVSTNGHASAVERSLASSYVDPGARATFAAAEPAPVAMPPEAPAAEPEPIQAIQAVVDGDTIEEPDVTTPTTEPVADAPGAAPDPSSTSTDSLDPVTGLRDAAAFARLVALEEARIARYHRPATIVVLELDGFDRLVDRLGPEAGDRILPALADAIRRLARGSDIVARLGPGRFGVLMAETDEVAAINYVERVRRACELWLESGAIALRLAIGWAGSAGDPPLAEAHRTAVERMYAESRRNTRRDATVDVAPTGAIADPAPAEAVTGPAPVVDLGSAADGGPAPTSLAS